MITIRQFIREAKATLQTPASLEQKQAEIAAGLAELAKRDDLTVLGLPIGPSDGSTANYLLWREPPHLGLVLGQFDPGYASPVHEHGDFWVVGCGYRGLDRWDMYERLDDSSHAGFAQVRLIDQILIPPGKGVAMPRPPRAIHSHNNLVPAHTLELIFSAAKPLPPEQRLIYDVEANECWPSPFNLGGIFVGDHYPPRPASQFARVLENLSDSMAAVLRRRRAARRIFCPTCCAYV